MAFELVQKVDKLLDNGGVSMTSDDKGVLVLKLDGNDMSVDDYQVVAVKSGTSGYFIYPYITASGVWRGKLMENQTNAFAPNQTQTITIYYKKNK